MGTLRHSDWHLLSEQKFRRRMAVKTTHQMFRGQAFIVLSDTITTQNLRLTERARELWVALDGKRTLNEIWEGLLRRPAIAPSQGELVEWIMHLVSAGLILSDHELDPRHLSDRTTKRRSGQIEQRFISPLSVKVKLFDPAALVRGTYPLVSLLFTPTGGLLVLGLLLTALVLGVMNADALVQSVDQTILSQSGLVSLALAYPIMKALHELSHCYALYRFGGQVREFGIMFLVFFPVPYVEATEATALPDKRARMLVGAAGIISELVIAAIALILWLQIEPGIERALLFNFILIGSVSTLLFNGNPLLKFDAYYVLSDWLEMPNLAQKSGEFLQDRFLSRVLGLRQDVEPMPGQAKIFAVYGVLSLAYRLLLTFTISLVVSGWFFVFGLLLAFWSILVSIGWPLAKLTKKGYRMAKHQNRMRRVVVRLALLIAVVVGFGTLVPLPFSAMGKGRIVPLPSAEISAATSGLITPTDVIDGARVEAGQKVMHLDSPTQAARQRAITMNVAFLRDQLAASGLALADRQRIERELEVALRALQNANEQAEALDVRAPLAGRMSWLGGQPPAIGTFTFRGDKLGQIVAPEALEVVVAFSAAFSGQLGDATTMTILLPNGEAIERRIARSRVIDVGQQAPAELMVSAGGSIPEQPNRPGMALDSSLVVWAAPEGDLTSWAGAHVEARIDLGHASAFEQLRFHLRRLFLRATRV